MAPIDLFCVPEDRHRIVLLADLLNRAGQDVVLREALVGTPSEPRLVACTGRSLRAAWVRELLAAPGATVALRLDGVVLPAHCQQVVELTTWPARSADRQLGGLVRWLRDPGSADLSRPGSTSQRRGATAVVGGARHRAARTPGRRWLPAVTVVSLLGLTTLLLWSLAREPDVPRRPSQSAAGPDTETGRAVAIRDASPSAPRGTLQSDRTGAALSGAVTATAVTSGSPDQEAALRAPGPPAASDPESDALVAAAASGGFRSSLSHLCEARSPAAARAWAQALNWRQRLTVGEVQCVAQLVARPGYEGLRGLLDLS